MIYKKYTAEYEGGKIVEAIINEEALKDDAVEDYFLPNGLRKIDYEGSFLIEPEDGNPTIPESLFSD